MKSELIDRLKEKLNIDVRGVAEFKDGIVSMNGEIVTLDNSCNGIYVRSDNSISTSPIGNIGCNVNYEVEERLVLVCWYRSAVVDNLIRYVLFALRSRDVVINTILSNKEKIFSEENISLEYLSRFSDYSIIKIFFTLKYEDVFNDCGDELCIDECA